MNTPAHQILHLTAFLALTILVLVITPTTAAQPCVLWSSYLGGTQIEEANSVAVDLNGNVYVAGYTNSPGWISGGWDTIVDANRDGFVVKFDSLGVHQWSSYIGGESYDDTIGIVLDPSGNVYVTGSTYSGNWISGGWCTVHNGWCDGYVVKLTPSGAHVWSSYMGGVNTEYGRDVAVDPSGNVYLTGYTISEGWVSGGWDTTHGGDDDGYVVKLTTEGAYQWSSYLGGTNSDKGEAIATDASGNVYVTGDTLSSSWVSGGWDTILYGQSDGYVVKLDMNGAHQWSSYLGGDRWESGDGIAVDASGNLYVTGDTLSSDWVSGGWNTFLPYGQGSGYVVKLDGAGSHQWSSYLGVGSEMGSGIAVDPIGNVYATGNTTSTDWVNGGPDTSFNGVADGYVVKLTTAGAHLWSSYLGGADEDGGLGIAVDASTNVYVVGRTLSSEWVSGGWDTAYDGNGDGYVVRIVPMLAAPSNPGATAIGTNTITWTWQDNSADETAFKVYDDLGAGPPVTLLTVTGANVDAWPHDGLNENTQYAFQVCATSLIGDGPKSDTFTAWTLAATPVAPLVTNPGADSFDVTIIAGDGNPANTLYAIQVDPPVDGCIWVQADGSLGMNPVYQTAEQWAMVTVTGLEQGVSYSVQVTAQNGAGADTSAGTATVASVSPQVPVAGFAGWAALFGGCLLAGTAALRKKRT